MQYRAFSLMALVLIAISVISLVGCGKPPRPPLDNRLKPLRTKNPLGQIFPVKKGVESGEKDYFSNLIDWDNDVRVDTLNEPYRYYRETRKFSAGLLGFVGIDDTATVEVVLEATKMEEYWLTLDAVERLQPVIDQKIKRLKDTYAYDGEYTFISTSYRAAGYSLSISTHSWSKLRAGIPVNADSSANNIDSLENRVIDMLDENRTLGLTFEVIKMDSIHYFVTPNDSLFIAYGFDPPRRKTRLYGEIGASTGNSDGFPREPNIQGTIGVGFDNLFDIGWYQPFVCYEGSDYGNGSLLSFALENRLFLKKNTDRHLQFIVRGGLSWAKVNNIEAVESLDGGNIGLGLSVSQKIKNGPMVFLDFLFQRQLTKGVNRAGFAIEDYTYSQYLLRLGFRVFLATIG